MSIRFGPGPVFAFEWLMAVRRWQMYATRSILVSLLLAALVVVWNSERVGVQNIRQMALVGEAFYQALVGTLLTLILLAAPAATAGSVCLDKTRGALVHLLVTDLSNAEIVLGKLFARLAPVLGLIATS